MILELMLVSARVIKAVSTATVDALESEMDRSSKPEESKEIDVSTVKPHSPTPHVVNEDITVPYDEGFDFLNRP